MKRTTRHFTTTTTPLAPPPLDDSDYEIVKVTTCAEFLAQNLTWADIEPFLSNSTVTNSSDACGFPVLNHTVIASHPVKYVQWLTYPLLLLICTVGNTLTLIVLSREGVQSVKWIFLMALAFSDLMFMWAQFFPWVNEIVGYQNGTGFQAFQMGIAGSCQYLQEMFITSSDWILVAFSIERFVAIVFPVWYHIMLTNLSKTIRAVISIAGIFTLAAVYSLWNLFDYYWYYYNDDKRCPPMLIQPPQYLRDWKPTYQMAVLIIPSINFCLILFLNTFVTLRLLYYREFRRQHAHVLNQCGSQGCQATRMLFATAVVYCLTQCFPFVFNILRILVEYPRCSYFISEDLYAKFARTNSFLVDLNYSVNFLLYSFISTDFRRILWEFFTGKPKEKQVRWYHVFSVRKPRRAMPLRTVDATDHGSGATDSDGVDQKRASIDTQVSTVESGWTISPVTSLTDDEGPSSPGIPLQERSSVDGLTADHRDEAAVTRDRSEARQRT